MAKPIIGANNKTTKIEITLPVDAAGVYAFDEDGKPVKGMTPVTFTVPRLDTIPPDQFSQINADVMAVGDMKHDDGTPLLPRERAIAMVLATVKPLVEPEVFTVLEGLTLFELEQIEKRILEGSAMTLGE
jgi:hypothetical protein